MNIVAVLSTTILPLDGTYTVQTITGQEIPSIQGVQHYIGHPDTKELIEDLGAVPAPSKLFEGLQIGESALCFPIQQGLSSRAEKGYTTPHEEVDWSMLSVRILTRVE